MPFIPSSEIIHPDPTVTLSQGFPYSAAPRRSAALLFSDNGCRGVTRAKCIHVRITCTWYRSHPLRDIRVRGRYPFAFRAHSRQFRVHKTSRGAWSKTSKIAILGLWRDGFSKHVAGYRSAIGSANFRGFSRWRELCSLCNRHHRKDTSNRSPVWNVTRIYAFAETVSADTQVVTSTQLPPSWRRLVLQLLTMVVCRKRLKTPCRKSRPRPTVCRESPGHTC